jgi:MOSC domain-containing protein YiiM/GNAT superfamily N-acetyltransferase
MDGARGMLQMMSDGQVLQVNVSPGGVPKRPVPAARVTSAGVEGDRQREVTVHGGPHRAVSLLGIEAIERVAAEGNPIAPGTTGENLTIAGFDVSLLALGTRLHVGEELVLEISGRANPCSTIRDSFAGGRYGRLGAARHPADSRMYARVLVEGTVRTGDPIRLEPPTDDGALRHALAARVDEAERASAIAIWSAAVASGAQVAILDDGDVAIAASPSLPSAIFNVGLGFAHLPNLVDLAVAHFGEHGVTGWIWGETDPWPDPIVDTTASLLARQRGEDDAADAAEGVSDGVTVRGLGRDEIGAWGSVIAAAADLPEPVPRAWRALELPLAAEAHHYRYVAEIDGHAVGAASLHVHHHVGWLRAATVLPEARGRGIQRALIAARLADAARLGCDLAGSLADAGGVSAANLERLGFAEVAVRRRYRVEPADRIA